MQWERAKAPVAHRRRREFLVSGRLLCKDDSGRCGREHTGVGMLVGAVGRWVGWVVGSGVGAAVGCSVGEAVGAVEKTWETARTRNKESV